MANFDFMMSLRGTFWYSYDGQPISATVVFIDLRFQWVHLKLKDWISP